MEDTFKKQLGNLLRELRGKHTIESHQTDRMFKLHNEYFKHSQEHGKSCGSCRSRVYKRLLVLWEEEEKKNK